MWSLAPDATCSRLGSVVFYVHGEGRLMFATYADAHREWHLNAGVPMGTPGCPMDACHPVDDYGEEPEPPTVRCGNCKDRHYTADDVRRCYKAAEARREARKAARGLRATGRGSTRTAGDAPRTSDVVVSEVPETVFSKAKFSH